MISALLLAASVTWCGAAHAGSEAEATVKAFHDALAQGNRDGALSTLSDEVSIYEQGWVEQSKAEYAAHHLDSDISFSKAVKSATTSVDVMVDGQIAVVTSQSTTKGTFEGKAIDSVGLETMVLRHVGDSWTIVHIHWSSRKAGKQGASARSAGTERLVRAANTISTV
jgi:ketosteroid isomerase-like protein